MHRSRPAGAHAVGRAIVAALAALLCVAGLLVPASAAHATPSRIEFTSGHGMATTQDAPFPAQATVRVLDIYGQPSPNPSVVFRITPEIAATFADGSTTATVVGDESGVVVAPVVIAGPWIAEFVLIAEMQSQNFLSDWVTLRIVDRIVQQGPPRIDDVVPGRGEATVHFTPGDPGTYPPTRFRVTARAVDAPEHVVVAEGGQSPIRVEGLTSGRAYVFDVTAVNELAEVASPPHAPLLIGAPATVGGAPAPGQVGAPYTFAFDIDGDPAPDVRLDAASALPSGLTFDTATATISGTPEASGTYAVRLVVGNLLGEVTHDAELVIAEADAPPGPPVIESLDIEGGSLSVSFTPGASGSAPTDDYEVVAVNTADPTDTATATGAGSPILVGPLISGELYTVTVTARSAAGDATSASAGPILLAEAPRLGGLPPAGVVGEPYSFAFGMSGSPAPLLVHRDVALAALPRGLVIDAEAGVLRGVPEQSGVFRVTLGAENVAGCDCREMTLVIQPAEVAVQPSDLEEPSTAPAPSASAPSPTSSADVDENAVLAVTGAAVPAAVLLAGAGLTVGGLLLRRRFGLQRRG